MTSRLLTLSIAIVECGVLSAVALLDVAFSGILAPSCKSWGAPQVFTDLVILAVVSCIWMVTVTRERGITAWPFLAMDEEERQ